MAAAAAVGVGVVATSSPPTPDRGHRTSVDAGGDGEPRVRRGVALVGGDDAAAAAAGGEGNGGEQLTEAGAATTQEGTRRQPTN